MNRPESDRVAWLSHRFLLREFGGDPGVIGRRVPFESFETSDWDSDVTVVGILGPSFTTLDLNNPPPALVLPARGNRPIRPTTLAFPFFKELTVDLGWFFLVFGCFIVVGAGNAVNLTDGLDGLAI